MKKLYVSDVDGTLYRGKSEGLSETGRELFIRLMQEGVELTVASGRNLYGVYDLAASCGITLPVIAYNGAVIYDFGKGKAERTFPIQPADAQGGCSSDSTVRRFPIRPACFVRRRSAV